jgi:hypothetical protein
MSADARPSGATRLVLVVANETLGGQALLDAVRKHAEGGARIVICVPRSEPRHGNIIYDDAVFHAAQVRVDLARSFLRNEGIEAIGEVGDPDPYTATIDAVHEHCPDEIVISTHPETRSGWLRRSLVERIEQATGLPVEHVVVDLDKEGLPFTVTLVVANRTASDQALINRLKEKASDEHHLFIVVVPQEGGHGAAAAAARGRLDQVLQLLRDEGLLCAGMIGDPDPYTATMNALHFFRIGEIVISTFDEHRSGWLRTHLVERVRNAAEVPVEHVVSERRSDGAPTESAASA